jgi:hypothetical protein
MSNEDEYRRLAAASLDSAKNTRDTAAKTRRLVMAEAWIELADRSGQTLQRQFHGVGDHPLVRRVLADFPNDAE